MFALSIIILSTEAEEESAFWHIMSTLCRYLYWAVKGAQLKFTSGALNMYKHKPNSLGSYLLT